MKNTYTTANGDYCLTVDSNKIKIKQLPPTTNSTTLVSITDTTAGTLPGVITNSLWIPSSERIITVHSDANIKIDYIGYYHDGAGLTFVNGLSITNTFTSDYYVTVTFNYILDFTSFGGIVTVGSFSMSRHIAPSITHNSVVTFTPNLAYGSDIDF